MWCSSSSRTCSLRPGPQQRRARSGSSCARSKPCRGRATSAAASSRFAGLRPPRTPAGPRPGCAARCRPSRSAKRVRRLSCRATRSARAVSQRRRRRVARPAAGRGGCCRSALGPRAGRGTTAARWAKDSGIGVRPRHRAQGRRVRPAAPSSEQRRARPGSGPRTGCGSASSTPSVGADAADQPGGQQRVAAEVEEAVVGADAVEAEHLGEQRAEQLLLRRRGAHGPAPAVELRRRQRPAVELAVGGQRQRVEHDDGGRHHVLRQPSRRACRRSAGGSSAAGRRRARRSRPAACRPGRSSRAMHRRLGHPRMRGQGGLDLARLDPEAADLDLVVGPAEELQHAVGAPAARSPVRYIRLPGGPERVGDEPLRGQARAGRR